MTPTPTSTPSDDQARIQQWLEDLRDGIESEKLDARRGLARVFEQRGMLEEATELLIANVRAGQKDAETFRWLSRLYRHQGQELLATQAAAEASKCQPPPDPVIATIVARPSPAQYAPNVARTVKPLIPRTHLVLFIGSLAVIFGSAAILIFRPNFARLQTAETLPISVPVAAPTPTATITRSGKAEVDLGTRPFNFGSNNQARELLALMEQQPGKAEYQVTYRTTSDVVVIGCDFASDTLARVHYEANDTGTGEKWKGHILHRLRSSAAGGSLNDTPNGKVFGTFEPFNLQGRTAPSQAVQRPDPQPVSTVPPRPTPTPYPPDRELVRSGTGAVETAPFHLNGGDYRLVWTARKQATDSLCIFAGALKSTRQSPGSGFQTIGPSDTIRGSEPVTGKLSVSGLERGEYHIAGAGTKCSWSVTVSPMPKR